MAALATLTFPSLACTRSQPRGLPALQTFRRSSLHARRSTSRFAQLAANQCVSSRRFAVSRHGDVSHSSEGCCSGSGRSGEELGSSGLVVRVSVLAAAASLVTAGASLADEVAASAVEASDAGISTTVSVLFVVATVGLVVLTGGVIYLGLTEFLEKRALQEEQKKVAAENSKKEKPAKQAVKAAARAGGPKGFGSGKRAGAKSDDQEVSN